MVKSTKNTKKEVKNTKKAKESVELTDEEINEILEQAKFVQEIEKKEAEPTIKWHPVAKKEKNGNFFSKALKFLGF